MKTSSPLADSQRLYKQSSSTGNKISKTDSADRKLGARLQHRCRSLWARDYLPVWCIVLAGRERVCLRFFPLLTIRKVENL